MTTKKDLSEQEWKTLLEAAVGAGMFIITSDVSLTNMGKELVGLTNAMQKQPVAEGAQELVTAIVADFVASSKEQHKSWQESGAGSDPTATLLGTIKEALAVLDAKGTAAEKAGFRTWLVGLAEATAEAGKEGGFLGIGAVRVSDQEKAALEQLKKTLELA
jgi:hypothetical protein